MLGVSQVTCASALDRVLSGMIISIKETSMPFATV